MRTGAAAEVATSMRRSARVWAATTCGGTTDVAISVGSPVSSAHDVNVSRRPTTVPWPDSERLDLFVERTVELLNEPAVHDFNLDIGFTLNADEGQPVTSEFRQPPEPLLRSFLMTFRQFVSSGDPLHVNGVHNLLFQHVSGDTMKAKLTARRDTWQRSRQVGAMRLELNGQTLEPADALDLWINGHYFHNDYRKAAELRRLAGLDGALVRHAALDLVVEGTRYVQFLGWAIQSSRSEGLLPI